MPFLIRLWQSWFADTVAQVEAESEQFRQSHAGREADWKVMIVLVLCAISLTGQNFSYLLVNALSLPEGELPGLLYWITATIGWNVLPALVVIKFVFRERLKDYGLKLAGWSSGWKIYLVFVAVMVPLVFVFSADDHFQRAYPFYRGWTPSEGWPKLLIWEVSYALQFMGLEFFFRGFLVHGLKHRFGIYSVFVMTVPYCMIHFRKPLPECVASIVAGIALGFMGLKTRSIWLGAALHISVAWGMDACCLSRRGLLN